MTSLDSALKIGIVCYPTFGGSGVVATELGKALAHEGHEVHFITYNQPVRLGSFHPGVFYHEVEVSKYPLFDYPPYELVLTSKMVEVAQTHSLNLLHVHYAIPHASAAVNAKRILAEAGLHVPVVTTLHGTDITLLGKDESFKPVITHAINASDVVTTVSESLNETPKRCLVWNVPSPSFTTLCVRRISSARQIWISKPSSPQLAHPSFATSATSVLSNACWTWSRCLREFVRSVNACC